MIEALSHVNPFAVLVASVARRRLVRRTVPEALPSQAVAVETVDVARLRAWSRQRRKVLVEYVDEGGRATRRTVHPFMVGYVATLRVVIAWCELRTDFRLFRIDRMRSVEFLDARYPDRPASLRRRWLAARESELRADGAR